SAHLERRRPLAGAPRSAREPGRPALARRGRRTARRASAARRGAAATTGGGTGRRREGGGRAGGASAGPRRADPARLGRLLRSVPDQRNGDVVDPAVLVGFVDQVLAGLAQLGLAGEDLGDPLVGNHAREAVAADQADVARLQVPAPDVHFGLVGHAERAGDHVLVL